MRIAYFTSQYPRATDTFIQREVVGLRQRGFDIRTFSVRRPGSEHDTGPEIVAEKRTTYYLLPVSAARLLYANLATLAKAPRRYLNALLLAWRTRRPGLAGLARQCAYLQEAIILARELRRQQITHVHNHLGDNSGTVTLLSSALTGIGYSMTIHGPHIFFDMTHWALREKLRYSRFIACISHFCRSQVMLVSDQTDWDRLKIVRCGVDPTRFPFTEVRAQATRLLYVGRLAVEKGLAILFDSLRQLLARGYRIELSLLGDGSDRETLHRLAAHLGIERQVVFVGYANQDRLRQHLLESDIMVLPSFAEGVPVSLMEAMACGVPVVSTYVGGVAELVQPELTGLLVPPADSTALCEAIARYLDDAGLRSQLSRAARQTVVSGFNLETQLATLAELFRSHADG
jgi:colanic acid/amylovoran biosynthesis glycosyltransferase